MVALPLPPIWAALPPEVNTSRLMLGAGPAPMLQAAGGWEALAILLESQAAELAGALSNLTSVWSGAASERAVAATMPMVIWLHTTAMQAQKRALQASAQASSYSLAMATTPPIPEIEQNHITNAVLNATNFLGVNTVPIGLNETDYFVRMWNQAAGAMDGYHAETTANLLFEPITPLKPIVMPGVGETALGAALAQTAPRTAEGAIRNATIAMTGMLATAESAKLTTGRVVADANHAEQRAMGAVQKSEQSGHQGQQQGSQGMQMVMQMGSQATAVPAQLAQMFQSQMQTITQPLQQVTQMVSQFSGLGGERTMQVGLMGASPFSSHPMLGGSGPASGAGLVRAASLPGAGGTAARTPLLSNMLGISGESKPLIGGAGSGSTGPLAPVGGGSGGGSPVAHAGKNTKGEANKDGLVAPTALTYNDVDHDDDDDW